MKTIDTETAEGLAEFLRLAVQQSTLQRASGLGRYSTRELLKRVVIKLALPTFGSDETGEPGELWLYPNCAADAAAVEAFTVRFPVAERLSPSERVKRIPRIEAEALADDGVRAVLAKLVDMRPPDKHAVELIDRINGRGGDSDPLAAVRYWQLQEAKARADGNDKLAKLCARIAAVPVAAHAMLKPERINAAPEPGKRAPRKTKNADPRVVNAQTRLDKYERATAGLSGDELTTVEEALAAAVGKTRKNYMHRVTEARKRRAKRTTPKT